MKLTDKLTNTLFNTYKYKTDSEAVIIACYFNPQNNPYRLKAFKIFYESIRHLNHRIIECVIGDAKPQLEESVNITRVNTPNLLWHKESLLNLAVANLPAKFKYVFWVDTDVIFTNTNWMVEAVKELKEHRLVQLFEYCIHLDKDQLEPHFDVTHEYEYASNPKVRHPKMWRSFGANYVTTDFSGDSNYDKHGHVGFAWGARREILDAVPLYDRALIGGADHVISHAAAGQIPHSCITKSFTENIEEVNEWSQKFYNAVKGKIGYVKGDLYHIWHGDIETRQYLKRIQEYTPTVKTITEKDDNGLHITNKKDDKYIKQYFNHREVKSKTRTEQKQYLQTIYPDGDDSFIESMLIAYFTDSTIMGAGIGGNIAGAFIGEMLADNSQAQQVDMGGGDFGGGGAGGTWDTPTDNTTNNDNTHSENFS